MSITTAPLGLARPQLNWGLQHAVERVAVERVAELQGFVEHGVALVPAELLEAGGVRRVTWLWGQRAALQAMAAEGGAVETGGGARLDDAGDGAGIDRRGADDRAGQGGLPSVPAGGRRLDAAEQRAFGDAGGGLPAAQRAHRAEVGGAIGDGDEDGAAGALALRAGQGKPQTALARFPVRDPDGGQLGAAQRPGEAEQQQGPIAQPNRDGDELWTYDGRHVGRFQGENVFGVDGRYLGELRGDDRLITRTTNPPRPRRAFTPLPARQARSRYLGFGSFEAVKGFADFPAPENL
jgi:hypothetical protein